MYNDPKIERKVERQKKEITRLNNKLEKAEDRVRELEEMLEYSSERVGIVVDDIRQKAHLLNVLTGVRRRIKALLEGE